MPTPPDAPPRPPSTPAAPRTPRYTDFIESATGSVPADRRGRRGGVPPGNAVLGDDDDAEDSDFEGAETVMVAAGDGSELQAAVVDRTASEKLMNPVIKVYCRSASAETSPLPCS